MKRYLGDSVYAATDHLLGRIILTTENGMSSDPEMLIVLEPETTEALIKFYNQIKEVH